MKCFFLICLMLLAASIAIYSQDASLDDVAVPSTTIQLRTYLEETSVPLNGTVVFHIELSWDGPLSRYRFTEPPQPLLTNLLILGSGSANRVEPTEDGRERAYKSITYQFRPLEMGMAYIDGLEISYQDAATGGSDMLHSQRLQVEIVDPVGDSAASSVMPVVYLALLLIFVIAIAYFVIAYFRKRNPRQSANTQLQQTNSEIYLSKLRNEVDPAHENLSDMSLNLSHLMREYMMTEFDLPSMGGTIDELSSTLAQRGLAVGQIEVIQNGFERMDFFKFAGSQIDSAEFASIYKMFEALLIERVEAGKSLVMKEA